MKRTKYELETNVLFNEAETTAEIETHDARLKKRLEQLCKDRPSEVRRTRQGEIENHFEFPKKWLKINPPRILTENQKAASKERAAKMRSAIKTP